MRHTKKWFIKRIGKKIYRDDWGCECRTCKDIQKNGLKILNEQHAEYLKDTQDEFLAEWTVLNYRKKK